MNRIGTDPNIVRVRAFSFSSSFAAGMSIVLKAAEPAEYLDFDLDWSIIAEKSPIRNFSGLGPEMCKYRQFLVFLLVLAWFAMPAQHIVSNSGE